MTTLRDTFDLEAMKAELIRDEGLKLEVYKDPGSGRAIGVGRNLDTQGFGVAEARDVLRLGEFPDVLRGDAAVEALSKIGGIISTAQAMTLLVNDITDRAHQLDAYLPWWRLLSPVRQRVLLNMAFEMGTHGFMQRLPTVWLAVREAQFIAAAHAMLESPWGQGKTHNRASRLAEAMVNG